MKKILAIVLALIMLLSVVACTKKEEPESYGPITSALLADFREVTKGGETDPEAIANKLAENSVIEFMPIIMPVEEGFLNGFSEDVTGFDSAAVLAPMIGSIPFICYVFNTTDADALVSQLKEKADLRWNICTAADEMAVEKAGSTVFFVMAPASFED